MNKIFKFWRWGMNITLSENKSLEIELFQCNWQWFVFSIECTRQGKIDHHGLKLVMGLLFYGITFNFYDKRHAKFESY
jgi:hypothetical protein